jgi:DNA-binding SARP family transcriptional activator
MHDVTHSRHLLGRSLAAAFWRYFGETLERLRFYITGGVGLETSGRLTAVGSLLSRQGRLLFAYLVYARDRPVSREELADALWSSQPPRAWEAALSALVSNLRSVLSEAAAVETASGCHRLIPRSPAWVDYEAALNSADAAEAALRAGDFSGAYGAAGVATNIAERPFLPGDRSAWSEARRRELESTLLRGLDVFVEVHRRNGEPALAARIAGRAVALEPFREAGHRQLMRAQYEAGDRAEALRTYQRLRELLRDELGVSPAPATEAVYLELLK